MTTAVAPSVRPRRSRSQGRRAAFRRQILPPLVCIGLTLLVWQLLSSLNSQGFPGPIQVITQTWDPYISQPFYDQGGTAKGLGIQIFISLQRVAVGYSLAAHLDRSGLVGHRGCRDAQGGRWHRLLYLGCLQCRW